MAIDDKIRDEKLQCDNNRETAKISALSSGKIDKYEFLTDEEILPPDQRRMIEQAKFAYSPLGKAFEKQVKLIEDQGKKQIKAFEDRGQQLTESNELLKKYFNIQRDNIPLEEQKNILHRLVEEKSCEFQNLKVKISPNNLTYKYKTERRGL